jgi:hypothetical protein
VSHLTGAWLAALVDAQLAPRQAERAVAHLATCCVCRERVRTERATRRALAGAADAVPSDMLRERLLALPAAIRASGTPAAARTPPRRSLAWAGALAASGAASVGGLFVLGLTAEPGLDAADLASTAVTAAARPVSAVSPPGGGVGGSDRSAPRPDGDSSTLDEAGVDDAGVAAAGLDEAASAAAGLDAAGLGALSGAAGAGDPTVAALRWMHDQGWSAPVIVPSALSVVDVRSVEGVLVVRLAGEHDAVVLLERRGRLDAEVLAAATPLDGGEDGAYLVSTSPWIAVKQSGDVAVAVVGHGSPTAGRQVLAAIPESAPELDAGDRIGRGWDSFTASLARLGGGRP